MTHTDMGRTRRRWTEAEDEILRTEVNKGEHGIPRHLPSALRRLNGTLGYQ